MDKEPKKDDIKYDKITGYNYWYNGGYRIQLDPKIYPVFNNLNSEYTNILLRLINKKPSLYTL